MVAVLEFVKKNKFLLGLFILSTAFFLYQHHANLSWDFSSYVENAKYFLNQGSYYEHYRPPLMPVIISTLSIFSWQLAEYLYIIIVVVLFLYSSIRFAKAANINKELFYLFSLSPYVLIYGLINGTELLSLALLQLFLAFAFEKKVYSGLFLGLASLARYNFLTFIPLLLLSKNIKKILQNIFLFGLSFVPWFLYNFYSTGNLFTAIVDGYAFNFKYRDYIVQQVNYLHILAVVFTLLPVFIFGVCAILIKVRKDLEKNKHIIMFVVALLAIYSYYITPFKDIRYIFPLVLPVSYFAVIGISKIREKSKQAFKILIIAVILLNIFTIIYIDYNSMYEKKDKYKAAIEVTKNLGIDNCRTLSNSWVFLNYLGKISEPYPRKELTLKNLDEGNFLLLFYPIEEPDWAKDKTFIQQLPVIHKENDFTIFGVMKKCNKIQKVDQTQISRIYNYVFFTYNISINTNPCFVMFEKNSILEKSCNFLNFKGFNLDTNRES